MTSHMQQTSLLAYASIKDNLSSRQADVLEVIELHGPLNNRQIAEWLHWPINTVTPRVLELRQKERVELHSAGPDSTGRKTNFWKAVV